MINFTVAVTNSTPGVSWTVWPVLGLIIIVGLGVVIARRRKK
ncbi:LPXTG cell wall anchor domain-containing protein [Tersicoccus phoenicis]